MPKGQPRNAEDIQITLRHIHSLGIATGEMIGGYSLADRLVEQGLLKKIWIGSYALTEAGKRRCSGVD